MFDSQLLSPTKLHKLRFLYDKYQELYLHIDEEDKWALYVIGTCIADSWELIVEIESYYY
jgi:hypothetical protein